MSAPTFIHRLWRHRTAPVQVLRRQLGPHVCRTLETRIRASEQQHGGEIRICIEAALPVRALWRGVTPRQRAMALFGELGIWNTQQRNGVLIYLLLAERAIEIVADRGLEAHVSSANWQAIVQQLGEQLRRKDYEQGLLGALDGVNALLCTHFPLAAGEANPNELPDTIALR
jgi:uncharacterized membrane protein